MSGSKLVGHSLKSFLLRSTPVISASNAFSTASLGRKVNSLPVRFMVWAVFMTNLSGTGGLSVPIIFKQLKRIAFLIDETTTYQV